MFEEREGAKLYFQNDVCSKCVHSESCHLLENDKGDLERYCHLWSPYEKGYYRGKKETACFIVDRYKAQNEYLLNELKKLGVTPKENKIIIN